MTKNISGYQQMLMDTSPKTAEYYGDKIAKLLNGGKDYMPKTVLKTKPTVNASGLNPIKGLGGATGTGLMLLPLWYGKGSDGAVGPGRALLEQTPWGQLIFGKPELPPEIKEIIEKNKKIKEDTSKKELNKESYSNNLNNQELNGLTPLPELEELSKSDLLTNRVVPQSRQANTIANQVVNNKLNESTLERTTTRVPSQNDINIVNDYLMQLQDTTQPYINALERYKKNYFKNLDQARRADLYFYGANLAKGLNPKAGEKFNPLQNQADIINTIKLIGDAKANQINAINELQGNIALANEMDLPAEAAFGNKNLLTALSQAKKYATDLEKARIIDAMRRYGYDTSYNRAIDQQLLRNQGNADVANIYMGSGVPGVGLQQGGTPVQQQTYSPIAQPQQDPRAQFFPNK